MNFEPGKQQAPPDVRLGRNHLKSNLRLQLYATLLLLDAAGIFCGVGLSSLSGHEHWTMAGGNFIPPVYIVIALIIEGYSLPVLTSGSESAKKAIFAFALTTGLLLLSAFFFHASNQLSRRGVFLALGFSGVLVVAVRKLFADIVRKRTGGKLISELVIVDDPKVDHRWFPQADVIDAHALGIRADVNDPQRMDQLGAILGRFDRVIIYSEPARWEDWALVLKGANVTGEIAQTDLRLLGAIAIGSFGDDDTLVVARGPLSLAARAQKRALDLMFTVPALVALMIPMLLVAIAIKLDTPGPVFFKQSRIGRGNRQFKIFKFRSMRVETSDATGNRSASRDDDRITRVGRIIRKTSIDELPQLINVLLGDMSLVGPRPHAVGSRAGNSLFWEVDREYWCRHALKPGITGLAQVRGFRGATDHHSDLQNRLEADLEYLVGWTLVRDVSILFETWKVVLHRNAF